MAAYLSLVCVATAWCIRCSAAPADEPPTTPPESEWAFVDQLAAPVQWNPHWIRDEEASGEANLTEGVRVMPLFPDPEQVLDTAYADLRTFLDCAGLPKTGPYRIVTQQAPTDCYEAFRLVVSANACRIEAGDTEGVRRGLYYLIDRLMSADGPFLSLGETERSPFIHTRISRCFFGPIKRPPMNRDELLDDVDYYPEGYLSRLAHDGVNGLWLTVEFKDLCSTPLTPECSPDRERRLEKLRSTVTKCRRYGIKVFLFCIEPRALPPDSPLLKNHPELGGAVSSGGWHCFCPFSDAAHSYLHEAVHDIFSETPNLGGLITISLGERTTTCLTSMDENWHTTCPRCAGKQPWEILRATLDPMDRGMRDANPDARLISWLYVPENGTGQRFASEPLAELARHVPPRVLVQYNFESGGHKEQLGKERHAGDYWLSYVGPSDAFTRVAAAAAAGGAETSAKIQACCSHEVATVPYVPVPGLLYRKYRQMRALGVTSVMQCWYFGNMPSLMNRAAASVLPFAPGNLSENEFLMALAQRDWGRTDSSRVVRAWRLFADAYDNYPLTNAFQYYGPAHDGVVWPLHLKPVRRVLSPTWRLDYPPSGDRIGECFSGTHTLEEVIELCRRMANIWQQGLDCIVELEPQAADDAERLRDISTAKALGIQFRSSYNILRFYALRERLLYGPAEQKRGLLDQLRAIVEEEIANSLNMAALCEANPFLGFHAESEGYRYFPAKLCWRVQLLRDMLGNEFAEAARAVEAGENVYPSLCGLADGPDVYLCRRAPASFVSAWRDNEAWTVLPRASCANASGAAPAPRIRWQAAHDDDTLYMNVECVPAESWQLLSISVHVEPTHVYPRRKFRVDAQGRQDVRLGWLFPETPWEAVAVAGSAQSIRLRIPLDTFLGEADHSRPMRLNVQAHYGQRTGSGRLVQSWIQPSGAPVKPRLGYGTEDPRQMGWLRLE